ncbi:MAG TPA: hypothetical protein VL100_05690, partial [Croceibacterium sp.]|nr:hypothetical protein [Croceibacterium sp.]
AVMPLIEALGAMADEGVKERAVEAIAVATPGEIAEILIANPGPSLVRSIRRTLELGQNQNRPAWAIASSNMEAAAKNLAARSPLNADRMRNWFRIEPN